MLAVAKGQVFTVLDTSSASELKVTDEQTPAIHEAVRDVAEKFVSVVRQ